MNVIYRSILPGVTVGRTHVALGLGVAYAGAKAFKILIITCSSAVLRQLARKRALEHSQVFVMG
jgi:hypothetical protein